MTFNYNLAQQEGISVFKLQGEIIDKSQVINLLENIDKLISTGKKRFVLELSGLKYVNSSGLNVFVNILSKARTAGGDVVVCNISKKMSELLLVTKLDSIFNILPSTEEAVQSLK